MNAIHHAGVPMTGVSVAVSFEAAVVAFDGPNWVPENCQKKLLVPQSGLADQLNETGAIVRKREPLRPFAAILPSDTARSECQSHR